MAKGRRGHRGLSWVDWRIAPFSMALMRRSLFADADIISRRQLASDGVAPMPKR